MTGLPPDRVLGLALQDGHGEQDVVVERSDGRRWPMDLRWWRGAATSPPRPERLAADLELHGPVLDVRCRTGRRIEVLAASGLAARGIDTCRDAVEIGIRRGYPCVVADVQCYRPPLEFGTVLALDGAIGGVGTLARLPALLARLATFAVPGGTVLVASIDWRVRAARDARFVDRQRRDGRYPGEERLRLRYGTARSGWFEWLWVDRDAMVAAAGDAGLDVTAIRCWRHHYVAQLVRRR